MPGVIRDRLRAVGTEAVLILAGAFFGSLACALAGAALTVWLTHLIGPVAALLTMAGGLFAIAAILFLVKAGMTRRRREAERLAATEIAVRWMGGALALVARATSARVAAALLVGAAILLVGTRSDPSDDA